MDEGCSLTSMEAEDGSDPGQVLLLLCSTPDPQRTNTHAILSKMRSIESDSL